MVASATVEATLMFTVAATGWFARLTVEDGTVQLIPATGEVQARAIVPAYPLMGESVRVTGIEFPTLTTRFVPLFTPAPRAKVGTGISLTDCTSVGEVLAARFPLPEYLATIVWSPTANVEVEKRASPLWRSTGTVPRRTSPSKNCAVPVSTKETVGTTVAVNVTDWPLVEGLREEVNESVVSGFTDMYE